MRGFRNNAVGGGTKSLGNLITETEASDWGFTYASKTDTQINFNVPSGTHSFATLLKRIKPKQGQRLYVQATSQDGSIAIIPQVSTDGVNFTTIISYFYDGNVHSASLDNYVGQDILIRIEAGHGGDNTRYKQVTALYIS